MFLLDTHLLLWSAYEPERLSAKAKRLIQDRSLTLAFSLASLWEIAVKTSLGRPDFTVDVSALRSALLNEGLAELSIDATHIKQLVSLPWVHRDPFDRMLVAQAMTTDWTLLSMDSGLSGYGKAVRIV